MQDNQLDFKDLTCVLFAGPAIVHADTFYREALLNGKIKDANYQIFAILEQVHIVDRFSKLTPLGNEVFACVDLIRYYLKTGGDMANSLKPDTTVWQYDLLRRGLGQHAQTRAIEYMDFIHTYINGSVSTVLDMGCGNGRYTELIGERYEASRCIMVDRDTEAVHEYFEISYPNSDRYWYNDADIGRPMNILPYKANLVLMNEVLHLNDEVWWASLMSNALSCSQPNGQICIGEVQPEPAFDWRMEAYTDNGRSMDMNEFMHWININYKYQFEESFGVLETPTHWFVMLTKRNM